MSRLIHRTTDTAGTDIYVHRTFVRAENHTPDTANSPSVFCWRGVRQLSPTAFRTRHTIHARTEWSSGKSRSNPSRQLLRSRYELRLQSLAFALSPRFWLQLDHHLIERLLVLRIDDLLECKLVCV